MANDRLYIHSYIKGAGRLLSILDLPQTVHEAEPQAVKLLDWLVDALVNVRREEKFFNDVAFKHGLHIQLPSRASIVLDSEKLDGLRQFERLFNSVSRGHHILPWLEGAIVFYATEKCYLDAWTWARSQLNEQDATKDADGGVLRTELIPNWSSGEFRAFVEQLGVIIDEAVTEQALVVGESIVPDLLERASLKWKEVLLAEVGFWPVVHLHSEEK